MYLKLPKAVKMFKWGQSAGNRKGASTTTRETAYVTAGDIV